MLDIMSKINNSMNQRHFTKLIFLDLKKAFDTVSHDILLQKLYHDGERGLAHRLFNINGCYFSTQIMQFGVSQGSNLGPILFSVYVNDIFGNFEFAPVLYADDRCLHVKAQK